MQKIFFIKSELSNLLSEHLQILYFYCYNSKYLLDDMFTSLFAAMVVKNLGFLILFIAKLCTSAVI